MRLQAASMARCAHAQNRQLIWMINRAGVVSVGICTRIHVGSSKLSNMGDEKCIQVNIA
jgi:hypothetical protein